MRVLLKFWISFPGCAAYECDWSSVIIFKLTTNVAQPAIMSSVMENLNRKFSLVCNRCKYLSILIFGRPHESYVWPHVLHCDIIIIKNNWQLSIIFYQQCFIFHGLLLLFQSHTSLIRKFIEPNQSSFSLKI